LNRRKCLIFSGGIGFHAAHPPRALPR
jgi:hypothetical protein